MKSKLLEGKKLEWAVLCLFAAAYAVISAFHEPWFDEAQAWQIARCASLREILFEIPHYEGHPPLWHLILAVPAKLGVPFEIGLKTVGFLISAASAALMLFRSRLPRPLRLALPFTYFFFYQYAVIVRPYGLMLFFMLLLGMELDKREAHQWRIVIIMAALCLTSAYGLLAAGGVSVCIVWEIWKEKGFKRLMSGFLRDRRTVSLLFLLLWAILLIWELLPAEDTFALSIQGGTSLPVRLFCAFFTFPLECFLTTSSWFGVELTSMQAIQIPTTQLILCAVLGLVLWVGIVCASSRRCLKFFLIPYMLYVVFAAAVYFSTHHMGIVFILVLFWAEFTSRDEKRLEIGRLAAARVAKSQRDQKLLRGAGIFLMTACMAVPLYWTAAAGVQEIRYDYYFSRSMAEFLAEKGLDEGLLIYCPAGVTGSLYLESLGNEDYINTEMIGSAVALNAYFGRNISYTLRDGTDSEGYVHHRAVSYEESRAAVANWRSKGIPDVVIGYPELEEIYGQDVSASDYTCVYKERTGFIWKNDHIRGTALVYVRNDLLDVYGLEAVDDTEIRYWAEGFPITDEMREAFANGVPAEEILKPYLDIMFGEED